MKQINGFFDILIPTFLEKATPLLNLFVTNTKLSLPLYKLTKLIVLWLLLQSSIIITSKLFLKLIDEYFFNVDIIDDKKLLEKIYKCRYL